MDFTTLSHAVQYRDLSWFSLDNNLTSCLSVSHKRTGDTVLHLACRYGRQDLLSLLSTNSGANFEISNFEGKKPLHEAAQYGQFECVRFLLEKGLQVDCLKRADWTPLMLACTKPQKDIIVELLSHGANPALLNKDGWNSFHIAAREGHVEILQELLSCNAELWNTSSNNGRTPLHTAALHGHLSAVRFLLEHCDYTPDSADSCGSTPLMDALRTGFITVADLLIKMHKADASRKDNLGLQAIHHAAQAGQTKAVDFLLTQCSIDADVATPVSGVTPLQIAAKENQEAVLNLLLAHGADINLADSKGRTALHIAAGAQHAASVRLLLTSGATEKADLSGQFARDLATREPVILAFGETVT
ncbi:hypothetical protein BaRGS_00018763 [Batillaria attramentaria]|uniref:Ankyrin repeat domain-containing protein 16 n=1 Tax=Batillaria attramentaria TaxID=370345 RepID=A0ABD0KST6_9CAEN